MHRILHKLSGGDRRSIGRANEVVAEVEAHPRLFSVLITGLDQADPIVRMRAADVAEKISANHPEYLQPHKRALRKAAQSEQQEIRWHVAQTLPRLRLTNREREELAGIFAGYLDDKSSIVKTCAMQALADLARQDTRLRARVMRRLARATEYGTAAMKSRGKRLLQQLQP